MQYNNDQFNSFTSDMKEVKEGILIKLAGDKCKMATLWDTSARAQVGPYPAGSSSVGSDLSTVADTH